jgi:peptide/nickel transport system permease protein
VINLPEKDIAPDLVGAEPVVLSQPNFWSRAGKSLLHDPVALCSVLFILLLVVVAVFAPWIAPYNPLREFPNGLSDVGAPIAPNAHFLLGTDEAGRDVLSRLIFGARVSLLVGVVATALASSIGVMIGTVSGYVGGVTESVLMRFTDMVLSFPILLFCVALISVTGPSTRNVVLVIAFAYWTYLARVVRGQVLSLKEREFVTAARTLGVGHFKIIRKHVLPHLMPTIIVYGTLGVATSILIEASLSFLGIGVPLPQASWGGMISEGQQYFQTAPWLLVSPGVALILTVLSINLAGDWLTDVLDTSMTEYRR